MIEVGVVDVISHERAPEAVRLVFYQTERFQEKWSPLFRFESATSKNLEIVRCFEETMNDLYAAGLNPLS